MFRFSNRDCIPFGEQSYHRNMFARETIDISVTKFEAQANIN